MDFGGAPVPRRRGPGSAGPGAAGAVLALAALLGCDPGPPQAWAPPATPDPGIAGVRQQLDRPFVVFSRAELEIDRLGEPVLAPILVGSRPSPATMTSDTPEVVSVEADGRLLAHREGRAGLRSPSGGPVLTVTVRVASAATQGGASADQAGGANANAAGPPTGPLSLRPARAQVRLGQIQTFEALTPQGPVAVSWSSSDERVVAHLQDHLFQGTEPGLAQVCARTTGRRVCADVEVTP